MSQNKLELSQVEPLKAHYSLLVIEDDAGDCTLLQEVVEQNRLSIELNCVANGEEALQYLEAKEQAGPGLFPELILLDLNLPGLSGKEILSQIRAREQWRMIPIIILTTSNAPRDVLETYQAGCNCYIKKPLGWEDFNRVMRAVFNFWLNFARLP